MSLRFLDRIVEGAAVVTFAASSLSIFLNVLNRYLVLGIMRNYAKEHESFRDTYFFIRNALGSIVVTADEVPGLLLVWVAFLGAYLAMRKEGHIAFEVVADALSNKGRMFLGALNISLICGFLVLLFWQSVRMIKVSGATEIETAEIAQGWFMSIIPIASVLMIIAVVTRFAESWHQMNKEE